MRHKIIVVMLLFRLMLLMPVHAQVVQPVSPGGGANATTSPTGSWLVYPNGATLPSQQINEDTQPVSPEVAPDATVLPFVPQNNDMNPQNYQLQAGAIVYSPPIPVPFTGPNPAQFLAAIESDSTVQPIFYLLAPYVQVLSIYQQSPATVQLIWSQLIQQYGGAGGPLTAALQKTITGYASSANMPLQ